MTMLDDHDQATADEFARCFDHIALHRRAPVAQPRRRSSRRFVAAAALVALGSAAAVALWPSSTDNVSAGWTPVPRAAEAGEVAGVLDACNGRLDAASAASGSVFGASAHVEFRGSVGLALALVDASVMTCTARLTADGWYAFGLATRPMSDSEPVLQGGGGADSMTWLVHGANRSAARVELTVPGYPTITATVVDGVYVAWWPDQNRSPDGGDLPELRIDIYDAGGALIDTITW